MPNKTTENNRTYRLLLINPRQESKHYAAQYDIALMTGKKTSMSPLGLVLLAALTPARYDVRIIDEELEPIPGDIDADLVGITTLSTTKTRAYSIADTFRAKGIPVVLGGPYATYMVEEGLAHADSVVIGEAENLWEHLLEDFETGQLKRTYHSETRPELKNLPLPRWDLVDTDKVLAIPVQVSRGCPYSCEFCVVTNMFGTRIRYRDIDDVVREIESLPLKRILFVDDNLTANKKYAKQLMSRLKPLGVTWNCQASIDVANDEEFLREMKQAGCDNIVIGFESLNPESLEETKKHHNKAPQYQEAIERIHRAGIHISASFIVGFDHDTLEELDNIFRFVHEADLLYAMLNILVCTPGSSLYRRMLKAGRLYECPAEFMGGMFPMMHYMNMGQLELFDKLWDITKRIYSFESIGQRAQRLFAKGYFSRPQNDPHASLKIRIRVTLLIIRLFVLTRDKTRRKFFFSLIKLGFRRKLAMENAFEFIFFMEAFNRFVRNFLSRFDENRKKITIYDKGPWKDSPAARP